MTFPSKSESKAIRIQQIFDASKRGYEIAAQLVMVGVAMVCGAPPSVARRLANSDRAKSLIAGHVGTLKEFVRAQLSTLTYKE